MLASDTYKEWTKPFDPTSYYEGDWTPGSTIKFLSGDGQGGMYSEIAENRANEFVSIRHIGMIDKGVIDTESDLVKAWTPSYENYTFVSTSEGTEVKADLSVPLEYEKMFDEKVGQKHF